MTLTHATEADYRQVIDLANLAYRGAGGAAGWSSERGILEGPRLTEERLREDLIRRPAAHLLLYREAVEGPLLGTVWLEPVDGSTWTLGLLTIHPQRQNRSLGRGLLAAAEAFARQHHVRSMRMTVVNVREPLIAWYERRGYVRTGETLPFPYGDDGFGVPLREDLAFLELRKPLGSGSLDEPRVSP